MHPWTPKDTVSLHSWSTVASGPVGSEAAAAQRCSQTLAGNIGPGAFVAGPGREHEVLGPYKGEAAGAEIPGVTGDPQRSHHSGHPPAEEWTRELSGPRVWESAGKRPSEK